MIFPVVFGHAVLAEHTSRLGNPLGMHRIPIAADQVMPVRQILAFADQTIGAGRRQPLELIGLRRGELDAIGHMLDPVGIIAAATGLQVQ